MSLASSLKNHFLIFWKEQNAHSILLLLLVFSLPFSVAFCNLLASLILIHFIFFSSGTGKEKLSIFIANRFSIAILVYVLLHLLGMLWTSDIESAIESIPKNFRLLLIPIFAYKIPDQTKNWAMTIFVIAMMFSNFIANFYCLGLIQPIEPGISVRTTALSVFLTKIFSFLPVESEIIRAGGAPFINRVQFSPMLAFAMAVILFYFLSIKSKQKKLGLLLLLFSSLYSLIETEGRGGQIVFLVFILVGIIYKYNSLKVFCWTVLFALLGLFLLYCSNERFSTRVQGVFQGWECFQNGEFGYGIGDRLIYTVCGWNSFLNSPLYGHGTSSFKKEYYQMKKKLFPKAPDADVCNIFDNPHNQYILLLVQFGVFGLISLLWLFWEGFSSLWKKLAIKKDIYGLWGLWLLLMSILLGFVDTYLWNSPSQHFFIIFSAILLWRQK